jgi:hypothetical protein
MAPVRSGVSEELSASFMKTPFFIVTAVKTSNLTQKYKCFGAVERGLSVWLSNSPPSASRFSRQSGILYISQAY